MSNVVMDLLHEKLVSLHNEKQDLLAIVADAPEYSINLGAWKCNKGCGWYGSGSVTIRNNEADLSFEVAINEEGKAQDVTDYSWSGWGVSSAKDEDIGKGLSYINTVQEMMTILYEKTYKPVAEKFFAFYNENVKKYDDQRYEIMCQIEKIKKEENENTLIVQQKNTKLFIENNLNTVFALHYKYYQINKKYSVRNIKFIKEKNKYYIVPSSGGYEEKKKLINDDDLLYIAEVCIGWYTLYEYNNDHERIYFKSEKMTVEGIEPKKETITEEEFKGI